MSEIFVLVEHRRGEIRDITFEMLTLGRQLAQKNGTSLTAVLLADHTERFTERLKNYADTILCIDEAKAENFNSEIYQKILSSLIKDRKPVLTLIGHTLKGKNMSSSIEIIPEIREAIVEAGAKDVFKCYQCGKCFSIVIPYSKMNTGNPALR